MPAIEYDADSVGVYVKAEAVVTVDTLDWINWASSGGRTLVVAEAGPAVDTITLTSRRGEVDTAKPEDDRFALLAVFGDGLEAIDELVAYDASGAVVGRCAPDADAVFMPCD